MANNYGATKILLLTGYLGAGKTTLLNRLLANQDGIRAAVLVNDIGEINVDASLIAKGALSQVDGELIPMTNGCLCCTLSEDLERQLSEFAESGEFDYIVIEASGICEPMPIAYTISSFCDARNYDGEAPLALDNIVAVVDCARMWDEFNGGRDLLNEDIEEDDVEALLIQQLEFCSTVVLNKCDCVSREQIDELRGIVRALQKKAVIVEATGGDVPMSELLNTGRFDFESVYNSAAWLEAMDGEHGHDDHGEHDHDEHEHDEHDHECEHDHDGHCHECDHEGHEHHHDHGDHDEHGHGHGHHHHHHHHGEDELEYGIDTFVYERRRPFDLDAFNEFAATWPREIVRAKGQFWCTDDPNMCFLFEQAGRQMSLSAQGMFIASAPGDVRKQLIEENPEVLEEWDDACGDRMTKICFIGRHMDKDALIAGLDAALATWTPAE